MPTTKSIIIIGAGIIGCSIAYQLAKRGGKEILILEKGNQLGLGSTGSSSAILRQRYTNSNTCQLAKEGYEAFSNLKDFLQLSETKCAVVHTGVLWLMNESLKTIEDEVKRLGQLGIKATGLDIKEFKKQFGYLSACQEFFDLTGAVEHHCQDAPYFFFEEQGGYADPQGANEDFLRAALNLGVKIEFNQRVTEVLKNGDTILGVKTNGQNFYESPIVINAGGPWCNEINQMAGLRLNWHLVPTRVQVGVRDCPKNAVGHVPVFADGASGIYGRAEANGQQIIYGSILPQDEEEVVQNPDECNLNIDADFRDSKLHALHHRIFGCSGRGNTMGYAGLYTINKEDRHPIIGATDLTGFFVANGFSGHGFKLAPSIGSMVAQIVTGEKLPTDSKVNPEFLSIYRKPIPVKEKNVLA